MRKKTLLMFALALGLTRVAAAAPLSSFYVIPYASHIPRADGIEMSDVTITNTQSSEIRVSITLISYGLHNTFNNIFPVTSTTVPARGTVRLADALKDFQGSEFANVGSSLGALLVASDDARTFAVSSRSYFQRTDGSTVGYNVPATADFLQASTRENSSSVMSTISGVRNDARYRTQIGFVVANAESLPTFIEFTLRNAAGTSLGTRAFYVGAGQFAQLEFPSTLIGDSQVDAGSVDVRVVGGGGVVAYAKVIDRASQDGTFVTADQPSTIPGAQSTKSPFRELLRRVVATQ